MARAANTMGAAVDGAEREVVPALAGLPAAAWDVVAPPAQPFVSHAILAGPEVSGGVGMTASGWLPQHLLARRPGGRETAAVRQARLPQGLF